MKRSITAALLAVALMLTAAPLVSAETLRPDVKAAMDKLVDAGAAGVQVGLTDGEERWTGTAGSSFIDRQVPVPENGRFRIGSITKTLVATAVMQLVDEGKVDLDKAARTYLPQFELDKRITVRMLLQHTSGLFNYTGEANPDGSIEPGLPFTGKDYVENRYRTYTPNQLVKVGLSKPLRFEPGTQWSYSNTNYVLLGLLIGKLTQSSYAAAIDNRILDPLRMRETYFPGTRFNIPGPHARGYLGYDGKSIDITRVNPSWASSAGDAISTIKDLDTFIAALLNGKLISQDSLREMLDARGIAEGYGLGVEQMKLPAECGGVFSGHTGGLPGYATYLFSSADASKRFQMSISMADVDLEDPRSTERLFGAAQNVITTALCGGAQGSPQKRASLSALPTLPATMLLTGPPG